MDRRPGNLALNGKNLVALSKKNPAPRRRCELNTTGGSRSLPQPVFPQHGIHPEGNMCGVSHQVLDQPDASRGGPSLGGAHRGVGHRLVVVLTAEAAEQFG
jgi:hypothetical protein